MANTDATTLDDSGPALLIPGMGEEGEQLVVKQTAGQQSDTEEVKYGTSRADRETSFDLADFPVLTGEEEDWRFTPLHRLAGLHLPDGDDTLLTGAAPEVNVTEHEGVTIETVGRDDSRLGSFMVPDDRTSLPPGHRLAKPPSLLSMTISSLKNHSRSRSKATPWTLLRSTST